VKIKFFDLYLINLYILKFKFILNHLSLYK